MERVAIVGPGGAGKSTFARRLADRIQLPVIHLDEHHWKPGWEPTPSDEWRTKQEGLLAAETWIVDGNYSATLETRLRRADTVIVFDFARIRCLARAFRRSVLNRGRAIQAVGCPEHIDRKFLLWVWRYPTDSKPKLDAALREYAQHTRVITFRTPREVRAFLRDLR